MRYTRYMECILECYDRHCKGMEPEDCADTIPGFDQCMEECKKYIPRGE